MLVLHCVWVQLLLFDSVREQSRRLLPDWRALPQHLPGYFYMLYNSYSYMYILHISYLIITYCINICQNPHSFGGTPQ